MQKKTINSNETSWKNFIFFIFTFNHKIIKCYLMFASAVSICILSCVLSTSRVPIKKYPEESCQQKVHNALAVHPDR